MLLCTIVPSSEFIVCDADGNNIVTAAYATFVLQKSMIDTFDLPIQNKTSDWFKYVDVDEDGNITAKDAAYIFQKTLTGIFEVKYGSS